MSVSSLSLLENPYVHDIYRVTFESMGINVEFGRTHQKEQVTTYNIFSK